MAHPPQEPVPGKKSQSHLPLARGRVEPETHRVLKGPIYFFLSLKMRPFPSSGLNSHVAEFIAQEWDDFQSPAGFPPVLTELAWMAQLGWASPRGSYIPRCLAVGTGQAEFPRDPCLHPGDSKARQNPGLTKKI